MTSIFAVNGESAEDRYVSVNLSYPDAKVATALCVGGPCMYQLKPGSGVTTGWLRQHVVPNMLHSHNLQESVVMVLAIPLLWAALDHEMEAYMLAPLRNRIRAGYGNIQLLGANSNPVKKVLVVVTGQEGEVRIDQLFEDSDDNSDTHIINRMKLDRVRGGNPELRV